MAAPKAKKPYNAPAVKVAAVEGPKAHQVTEYVLRQRLPDGTDRPLVSDHDIEVVRHCKVQHAIDAVKAGYARPDLFITARDCSYPLNAKGERMAQGSTCDESEVE